MYVFRHIYILSRAIIQLGKNMEWYVFLRVEPHKIEEIVKAPRQLDRISVERVHGIYDIVLRVETETVFEVDDFIKKICNSPHVKDYKLLMVVT